MAPAGEPRPPKQKPPCADRTADATKTTSADKKQISRARESGLLFSLGRQVMAAGRAITLASVHQYALGPFAVGARICKGGAGADSRIDKGNWPGCKAKSVGRPA